jgi:hypothetical protein
VLERHVTDLRRELPGESMERKQPLVLDTIVAEHLLDDEQRVGPDVEARMAMGEGPFERRDQPPIFRDVVGGETDALVQLRQHLTVLIRDDGTVSGRPWVASGAAVDVRGDHGVGRWCSSCRA